MIEVLVTTIVSSFLLPHVKAGVQAIAKKVSESTAESFGKSVGDAAGKQAASVTEKVWSRVKGIFGGKPSDEQVFQDFEANPDKAAGYLELRLTDLLKADPDAVRDLLALTETKATGTDQTITDVIGNSGVTITISGSTLTNSPITGVYTGPASNRPLE